MHADSQEVAAIFFGATRALASHTGSLQERLADTYADHLLQVAESTDCLMGLPSTAAIPCGVMPKYRGRAVSQATGDSAASGTWKASVFGSSGLIDAEG